MRPFVAALIITLGSAPAFADGLLCALRDLRGQLPVPGFGRDIEMVGDIAYVCDTDTSVVVVDISDRDAPTPIGSYASPEGFKILDLLAEGDLLFVVEYGDMGGLRILDVSDPTSPTIIGELLGLKDAGYIDIVGDNAVLSTRHDLMTLDTTDPTAPAVIGAIDVFNGHPAGECRIVGDYVLLARHVDHGAIYDISDPANPTYVGLLDKHDPTYVEVDANLAFVGADNGNNYLTVFDVTNPAQPVKLTTIGTPDDVRDVIALDGRLYIADADSGVLIYDLSTPQSPALIGHYNVGHFAYRIGSDGATVCALLSDVGLQLIDVTDPAPPPLVGSLDTSGCVNLTLVGDLGYVAAGRSGMCIADVSSPDAMFLLGGIDTPGTTNDIEVDGDFAFLADGETGLRVINVANPTQPVKVGDVLTPGHAFGVDLSDKIAFVASDPGGVAVFNVSNPAFPQLIDVIDTPGRPRDVLVDGNVAYVASYQSGLYVYDVSDPANITQIAFSDQPKYALRLHLEGDLLYIANSFNSFYIVDVSNPTSPVVVGQADVDDCVGITVDGDLAFASSNHHGLHIFDVSDPARPILIARYDVYDGSYGVTHRDGLAYVCFGLAGVHVVNPSDCPPCPADFNADGNLNLLDFVAFQIGWLAQDPAADCNADAVLDILDFVCFQGLFQAGCP